MHIETGNYNGNCRREGGGKLRLALSDFLKVLSIIVIPLIVLLIVGTVAWTNIKADVVILKEKASEVKDLPTQMAVLQTDVEYIKGDMQEVKSYVNEIKTDIKTLLRR